MDDVEEHFSNYPASTMDRNGKLASGASGEGDDWPKLGVRTSKLIYETLNAARRPVPLSMRHCIKFKVNGVSQLVSNSWERKFVGNIHMSIEFIKVFTLALQFLLYRLEPMFD
jgi:hypothetical protein